MSRRTLTTLITAFVAAATGPAFGQTSVFPWEGEVTGNNVNVRSGEGTRYYATCKLAMGDRVLVLGESSGWYKILPPPTSFSYIDKTAIERHTDDIGTVSRDKAYVRAGSHISRRKSRTQVILTKGEPVVILGEADGFYKIEPPKRAVLYVARDFIKPVEAGQESGLLKRYSAADWSKAGSAESDAEAAATPDLPDNAESSPAPRTVSRPTPVARDSTAARNTSSPATTRIKTVRPDPVELPTAKNDTTSQPPIRANRAMDSSNAAPRERSTNSTLVLTPSNPSANTARPQPAPHTESSSAQPRDIETRTAADTREATDDGDQLLEPGNGRDELVPATRRPPAEVPDWARNGEPQRNQGDRIAASSSSPSPSQPRPENRIAARSAPRSTTPSSSSTIGTMVEITPNTPRRATNSTPNRNINEPTRIAANTTAQPAANSGTQITTYHRPDPTTLTLNATDSNNGATSGGATTPIASNTSSGPQTIVDTSNSHPAGATTTPGATVVASNGTTNSDTYYINGDSAANAQTATQNGTVYPTNTTPPPNVPIDPNSGPYAAQLVKLEGDLYAIMDMPVQQRPYEQLIANYEEIAVQTSEQVPAQYASIRIDQIKSLERVRRLAVRYASDQQGIQHFSQRMSEERAEIRRAANESSPSTQGGAFEYEGQLMKSYAFSPEKRRYRLIDPGTQTTIIYVDIPVDVVTNPDTLTGKRVGIRIGSRQYSEAAQIPIVEAAQVIDLTSPPTKYQPIPGPQSRNSRDFSNAGNTRGDHPNPLMNESVARERTESRTMGEMEPIES